MDLKDAFNQITLAESTPSYSHIDSYGNLVSPMYAARPKNSVAAHFKSVLADVQNVCDPYINSIIIRVQKKEGMIDQDLIVVGV